MAAMEEDFDIDKFLAEVHADVPLIHRLGFFSDVFVDYLVEFEDVAAKLRELGEVQPSRSWMNSVTCGASRTI